jgi:site-specific DNA-methyltransferase (adenine-specific)
MEIIQPNILHHFNCYTRDKSLLPLLILGDANRVLQELPEAAIDFCMTSPPYWGKREYHNGGIGLEVSHEEYISNLVAIFAQVKRVLKPTGSFWLNIGDTYFNKRLLGIPWKLALALMEHHGWVLRNSVIWNKIKGGLDNTNDRLANIHEHVFHFVKNPNGYYYNVDSIRTSPRQARVINGAVVSATGIRGVRYRRQIELSTALTNEEKKVALKALDDMLGKIGLGEISDFRMIIRGQQHATHSDSERVSGRAKELRDRGFYFLKYHPKGSKPGDVWDILPEDTQNRNGHFALYPEDLCKIPILATCPPDGLVLDPFCGTGTTLSVVQAFERKSIGIDVSEYYLQLAEQRCHRLLGIQNFRRDAVQSNWNCMMRLISIVNEV